MYNEATTREKVEKVLIDYLKKKFPDESMNITPNTLLVDELGIDSVDGIDILFGINDLFQIDIPNEYLKLFAQVEDIIEYLMAKESELKMV